MYHTFKENFNILLYSDQDRKELDHWLSIEALRIHSAVEYNNDQRHWLPDGARKMTQLNSLRSRGFKVELVIEPDPSAAATMIMNGFNLLTFTHAQYAMPKWRPDYNHEKPSWNELSEAAENSAKLKAIDERIKIIDAESEWR